MSRWAVLKAWTPLVAFGSLVTLSMGSYYFYPDAFLPTRADATLLGPSLQHWLGTDSLGRDYLLRLILGTRTSLIVALGSTSISLVMGIMIASFISQASWVNRFLYSRFVDILSGLPSFMLIAVIMQILQSHSLWMLMILMGAFHWMGLARLTQAEVLKVTSEPYIEAARALGASRVYLFYKHIWPACYGIWFAWFLFHLPAEIMFESSLSFLGFGVQAPDVSLGILVQEAWNYLSVKPYFLLAPSTIIFILVLSLYQIKWRR